MKLIFNETNATTAEDRGRRTEGGVWDRRPGFVKKLRQGRLTTRADFAG
jgi:hypothetical protein